MKITAFHQNSTLPSKLVGVYRICLGITFLVLGSLKSFDDTFKSIWATQLLELNAPFFSLFYNLLPVYETVLGAVLLVGFYSRLCAILILPILALAIYTQATVINPGATYFGTYEAFYPSLGIMMDLIILLYGGGRWSMDHRRQMNHPDRPESFSF